MISVQIIISENDDMHYLYICAQKGSDTWLWVPHCSLFLVLGSTQQAWLPLNYTSLQAFLALGSTQRSHLALCFTLRTYLALASSADQPDIWFYAKAAHTELHCAVSPGSSVVVQEGRRQPGDQAMGLAHHQPLTGSGVDVETAQDLGQLGPGLSGGDISARPAGRAVLTLAVRRRSG